MNSAGAAHNDAQIYRLCGPCVIHGALYSDLPNHILLSNVMANPKQSAVDLAKFIDKGVHVKLAGGREGEIYKGSLNCYLHVIKTFLSMNWSVSGVLKGYDQLLNLVLDEGIEYIRGES